MFTSNDLVYHTLDNEIQSGGMKVNSILLQNGGSLGSGKKGGTISTMLGDLVVPVGLIYLQERLNKRIGRDTAINLNSEPISETLYEKILGIDQSSTPSKKKTRKRQEVKRKNKKNTNNKKTRK
jgi:hypothetical protein